MMSFTGEISRHEHTTVEIDAPLWARISYRPIVFFSLSRKMFIVAAIKVINSSRQGVSRLFLAFNIKRRCHLSRKSFYFKISPPLHE